MVRTPKFCRLTVLCKPNYRKDSSPPTAGSHLSVNRIHYSWTRPIRFTSHFHRTGWFSIKFDREQCKRLMNSNQWIDADYVRVICIRSASVCFLFRWQSWPSEYGDRKLQPAHFGRHLSLPLEKNLKKANRIDEPGYCSAPSHFLDLGDLFRRV